MSSEIRKHLSLINISVKAKLSFSGFCWDIPLLDPPPRLSWPRKHANDAGRGSPRSLEIGAHKVLRYRQGISS